MINSFYILINVSELRLEERFIYLNKIYYAVQIVQKNVELYFAFIFDYI